MPVYQPPSLVPRLIAARVDFFGEHEPQRCYASIPHASGRLEDGFRDITYQMLALAIDKAAWWLDSVLSSTQTSVSPETFAYSGPNDLRYPVLAVAGIKTGRKVRLIIFIGFKIDAQSLELTQIADSYAVPVLFQRGLSQALRRYCVQYFHLYGNSQSGFPVWSVSNQAAGPQTDHRTCFGGMVERRASS